jgi:hypothetical protein
MAENIAHARTRSFTPAPTPDNGPTISQGSVNPLLASKTPSGSPARPRFAGTINDRPESKNSSQWQDYEPDAPHRRASFGSQSDEDDRSPVDRRMSTSSGLHWDPSRFVRTSMRGIAM